MPFALGQQGLLGPPHDGERAAQPPVWESEARINDVSQLSPPGFGQSTGGAQEQAALSAGLVQLMSTREAEPHRHSSPASGQKYSCKSCVKIFKQPQGLARHIREVHDSPPKCPFCPNVEACLFNEKPPDKGPWRSIRSECLRRYPHPARQGCVRVRGNYRFPPYLRASGPRCLSVRGECINTKKY